jgi:hypothetical protein
MTTVSCIQQLSKIRAHRSICEPGNGLFELKLAPGMRGDGPSQLVPFTPEPGTLGRGCVWGGEMMDLLSRMERNRKEAAKFSDLARTTSSTVCIWAGAIPDAEQGTCPRRADPLAPICEIEMRSSDLPCSVQISLLLLRRNQKLHYPEPHSRLSPTHQTE